MNYGFVIDNRRCIGCHACSVACKSENEVPLGVSRTWVKYTEVGKFPDVKRHFQVTRCNHCSNPPCVRICPVTAMYQRDDGIVEFDPNVCIGCKACLQACPYDAIHIDPGSGTAAKCHFCSHRIEVGLEPACVVVCPEHAIIAGDMDDPSSEISKVMAKNSLTVRKPEQGTGPKLFYIDGHDASLTPSASAGSRSQFLFAENLTSGSSDTVKAPAMAKLNGSDSTACCNPASPCQGESPAVSHRATSGATIVAPGPQGRPYQGSISIQGTRAEQMVQVAYNAQHRIPWHWQVPAYLVTKAISAGILLFFAGIVLLGNMPLAPAAGVTAAGGSVVFALITTALLVFDLERPERFLRILFRPQWKSWLARGAFLLVGFSLVATAWLAIELVSSVYPDLANATEWRPFILGLGVPLAIGAAVYTAFLFGQAEGRDLWQSPLLPWQFMLRSILCGTSFLLIVNTVLGDTPGLADHTALVCFWTLVLNAFSLAVGEFTMSHQSEQAAAAAASIVKGRYRHWFWLGSIAVGHLLPAALLWIGNPDFWAITGLTVIAGLFAHEYAFVMAPQELTNS